MVMKVNFEIDRWLVLEFDGDGVVMFGDLGKDGENVGDWVEDCGVIGVIVDGEIVLMI